MKRAKAIAAATSKRRRKNWVARLDPAELKELIVIRKNWKNGKPPLNGREISELIKTHFPTITVSDREVYQWLAKSE